MTNKRSKGKSVHSAQNKALTAFLKRRRMEAGLTMRVVGEMLNVPHSVVGKIENQERRLDVVELVLYCNAIGVDPQEALKVAMAPQCR